MGNLQVLDRVLENGDLSYVDAIQKRYRNFRFTNNQKRACEIFLFEPTEDNAYKALGITPKAYFFVKGFLSTEQIVTNISQMICDGKIKRSYLRTLVNTQELNEIVEILLKSPCANKLDKYLKQVSMARKLKI
jgi:hypothetical protein